MAHNLCHWEIPADDPEALKTFYEKLFSWKFTSEIIEGDDSPYLMFSTGENGVGGGIFKRPVSFSHIMNYIYTEKIEDEIAKARELGAEIMVDKAPVPGIGWYAIFKDPAGNLLGLFQNDSQAKPKS